MFFIQREVPSAPSSIAYFMGCIGEGKSIAVDVHQQDMDWVVTQAEEMGVQINYVIDTHVHADHLSGGFELAQRVGAQYLLHESSATQLDFTPVKDGEVIQAGNVVVKVIHTPGHTRDSICLLVSDFSRSEDPWFLLSQHTLFIGSVGRPDLAGEEQEMAGLLYDSIHQKLLSLPDYIEVLPGEKAGGVCGVGLSAKPVSTIGYERKHNRMLQLTKEDFIEQIVSDLPPRPDKMSEIIAKNLGLTKRN